MSKLLGQDFKIDVLVPPAANSGTVATAAGYWRHIKLYNSLLFIITVLLDNAATAICTVQQATDADGTSARNLATSKAITLTGSTFVATTTGTIRVGYIEVNADLVGSYLSGTFPYVGISCVMSATDDIGVVLIRGNPRYSRGKTSFPTDVGKLDT